MTCYTSYESSMKSVLKLCNCDPLPQHDATRILRHRWRLNTEIIEKKISSISNGSLISQSHDSSEMDLIKMLFCMSFQFPRRGYENMKYIVGSPDASIARIPCNGIWYIKAFTALWRFHAATCSDELFPCEKCTPICS